MTDMDKMMIERYTIRQTQDGYAAVIDNARDGETFCLIDPDDMDMGGADCALARAKDIAEMFNRVTAYNPDDRLSQEVEELKHDLKRQMTIANTQCNEVDRLREALDYCAALPCQTTGNEDAESGCCLTCRARATVAALSPLPQGDG